MRLGFRAGLEHILEMIEAYQPDDALGNLFHCVQMEQVFCDSKTFADCKPVI
ncbi:MAG: hypothetical protein ETSY2_12845 [Candidatus Entotheonella gemina]|uniref:Uncharacterized protein n=1 Tax=Candidatus Entotheonella gemina TaxID=1429439 RepID=W4MAD0_9BACT|nr:MAG: hypothetical protein ETSY2_12845 [Candidatus Entotheonella gemina]